MVKISGMDIPLGADKRICNSEFGSDASNGFYSGPSDFSCRKIPCSDRVGTG